MQFLMTGTKREFDDIVKDLPDKSEWRFISSEDTIKGLKLRTIFLAGTYYNRRPVLEALMAYAAAHRIKVTHFVMGETVSNSRRSTKANAC